MDMKIRFTRAWRHKQEGDVAELPDGTANVLIRRRIAVAVGDAGDVETAAIDTSTRERPKRRKRVKARAT